MRNETLKGALLVGLGAVSYGMLATFVKLAYKEGFTTAEVTSAQFIYGIIGMLLLLLIKRKKQNTTVKLTKVNKIKLLITGTSLGFTSVFYYLCVKYVNVSVAIILLMQSVWIGVLLEWLLDKKKPNRKKSVAVIAILFGTLLATNVFATEIQLHKLGVLFGCIAALSFATTMFATNKIALGVMPEKRSYYMLLGGAVIILFFVLATQETSFNFKIFYKWGILLALFGTIIPPLLMNMGFPKIDLGLGSIISSLELPVSVFMAYAILHEKVQFIQWIGILIILGAVVIMNSGKKK